MFWLVGGLEPKRDCVSEHLPGNFRENQVVFYSLCLVVHCLVVQGLVGMAAYSLSFSFPISNWR